MIYFSIGCYCNLSVVVELFDKNVSDAISSLFRVRSASDYDDFYVVAKQDAVLQLQNAKNIVSLVDNYLNKGEK